VSDVAGATLADELAGSVKVDLAALGNTSDEGPGVSRLAYSERDAEARRWFESRCSSLGRRCEVDAVGNAFAFSPAAERSRPILLGSHLDSVLHGGAYDGTLGVLLALAVVGHLRRAAPEMPMAVESFACEESTRFGFGAIGSR